MLTDDSIQSMGGKARAEALSPAERTEIASKASMARWSLPKVICGAPDRPLRIGNIEIPCYVLEGEKRVLVQRAIVSAMGMARGGSSKGGGDRLAHFVNQKLLNDYISNDLRAVTGSPLKFITPNGNTAHGYEAEFLAKLCFAVMDAERAGVLQEQQKHIAKQCRILIEGFSIVGINALVDEATGYQEVRDKTALQKILEKYVKDEWAKWTRRFPHEFYKHLFRLKNAGFSPEEGKLKPSYVGHWTNDVVYSRLAPGVLKKLREVNPKNPTGHRSRKHHQHLTEDVGVPELQQHLSNLTFLMKGCQTWSEFKQRLDIAAPKFGDTMSLNLSAGGKK
jgi:hypothetical protein